MPETETISARGLRIDTVRLTHAYSKHDLPATDELRARGFKVTVKDGDGKSGSIMVASPQWKFDKRGTAIPYVTVTRSEYGYCGIAVTISLAKMLNHTGLEDMSDDDLDCALTGIEDYVRQRVGVEFVARTAKTPLVDYNADWQVGEHNVIPFVGSMSSTGRLKWKKESLTSGRFENTSRAVRVYGKRAEMQFQHERGKATSEDVKAAAGLLRVEVSLRSAYAKERAADGHHPLSMAAARRALESVIAELRFNQPRASASNRDELLRAAFPKKVVELAGVLNWRDKYGEESLKAEWGAQKLNRVRQKLANAGLWEMSSRDELPALRLAA